MERLFVGAALADQVLAGALASGFSPGGDGCGNAKLREAGMAVLSPPGDREAGVVVLWPPGAQGGWHGGSVGTWSDRHRHDSHRPSLVLFGNAEECPWQRGRGVLGVLSGV